jgi:hypothetical protein
MSDHLGMQVHEDVQPLVLHALRQDCLRLGQSEGHPHGTVEVDGDGQCGAGLLRSPYLAV